MTDVEIDDFADGDDETEETDLLVDLLLNNDASDGVAVPGSKPNGTLDPSKPVVPEVLLYP